MWTRTLGVLSVASALALVGCGNDTSTPAPTTTPAPATPAVASAVTAEAQKLIDQATQYIKDNKWDLADKGIKQLEDMKAKLPPEYGPKIDDLRKLYNTAKSAAAPGGLSLPK